MVQHVQNQLVTGGLWLGVASPVLYAAAQLLAAPLYPGYDWTLQLASELGSVGTTSSDVFNPAITLSGFAMLASAIGFKLGLQRVSQWRLVPWLVAASLVSGGSASVWAGLHPLPDPAHNPGYWGIGTVAFPLLLTMALWQSAISRVTRIYLASNAIAILTFLLFSFDLTSNDPSHGIVQRIGALLVYAPVAFGAITLLRMER